MNSIYSYLVTIIVVVVINNIYSSNVVTVVHAVCDGNPHDWERIRRCDQQVNECSTVSWGNQCGTCEGIGGIAQSDKPNDFRVPKCETIATAEEIYKNILLNNNNNNNNKDVNILTQPPVKAIFPKRFINTGFYEVQIFVKHDPFCLAQIPAMTSNGTHCYKAQQGTFNFDGEVGILRTDYFDARTTTPNVNMTEIFYHEGHRVHPQITHYGKVPTPGLCPCIDVGTGAVSYNWAEDAEYIGREKLEIEFMWEERIVDHWIKGPHHVWSDLMTGEIVRLWQPFNGLEIFDVNKYDVVKTHLQPEIFDLPFECKAWSNVCIDGTQPSGIEKIKSIMEGAFSIKH